MKPPRGSTKEQRSDFITKDTYKGNLPSIVGRQRLLVRANGKESFIYVEKSRVEAKKLKYGKDFIRDCGEVIKETKRVNV